MDPGRYSEPRRRSFNSLIVSSYLFAVQVIATSMGQLLTDSLSLYGSEEELLILLEIASLAGTLLGTAVKDGNLPLLAPLLSCCPACRRSFTCTVRRSSWV